MVMNASDNMENFISMFLSQRGEKNNRHIIETTHIAGIIMVTVNPPSIGNRYFSARRTAKMNVKAELKSASCSAIGVPTSSGIRVITADAADDEATSSKTVFLRASKNDISSL